MSDEFDRAFADHYRTEPARTAKRRAEQAADRFVPDPSHERLIDAAKRDPDVVSKLGVGLEHAIYVQGRRAAIDTGRFDPDAWREEQGIE